MSVALPKEATPPERKWDGIIRRELAFEMRDINVEERSIEVVCSTDTLDSHGDIVEQTFDLKRYKKNPVVLWLHNSFGWFDGSDAEDYLPIGRAEGVKVEDGQLVAKIFFLSGNADEEPLVDKIWRRVQQRVLRAVSIGFRPGKVTREENADTGKVTYRLSKNELYEISVVPIPSNPDAVAKSIEFEHENLRRLAANDSAPEREAQDNNPMAMTAEEQKALTDAQAGKTVAETQLGEVKAKNLAIEGELTAEKAKVTELTNKCSGLELKCGELGTQLKNLSDADTARKAAEEEATKKADATAADVDVDAVVGKKIAPTAREKWLAIRLRSKSEFDGLLADMPELPHLKQIVPPGAPPSGGGGGQSLIDEARA